MSVFARADKSRFLTTMNIFSPSRNMGREHQKTEVPGHYAHGNMGLEMNSNSEKSYVFLKYEYEINIFKN